MIVDLEFTSKNMFIKKKRLNIINVRCVNTIVIGQLIGIGIEHLQNRAFDRKLELE